MSNEPDVWAPPISDPVWEALSRPLLDFLIEGPKDWRALNSWAHSTKLGATALRQRLAWLEQMRLATSIEGHRQLPNGRWRRTLYWVYALDVPTLSHDPNYAADSSDLPQGPEDDEVTPIQTSVTQPSP